MDYRFYYTNGYGVQSVFLLGINMIFLHQRSMQFYKGGGTADLKTAPIIHTEEGLYRAFRGRLFV